MGLFSGFGGGSGSINILPSPVIMNGASAGPQPVGGGSGSINILPAPVIAGGSTGATASPNFSLSIPQWGASGTNQAAALSVSMNLPDPASVAAGAYAFTQNNLDADSLFVNNGIAGAQSFLAHQISPILATVGAQVTSNAQQSTGIMATLSADFSQALKAINQNVAIGSNASLAASQASIASSNAAASAGGCFLTTAVCEIEGQADDCDTLQTLRAFRDDVMLVDPLWSIDVERYYDIAPKLAQRLSDSDSRKSIAYAMRAFYIDECLRLIRAKQHAQAVHVYRDMVAYLESAL